MHIGTDICQVSRVHRILSSELGGKFIRRVLCEEELVEPRACVKAVLERGRGTGGGSVGSSGTGTGISEKGEAAVGGQAGSGGEEVGEDEVRSESEVAVGGQVGVGEVKDAAVFMAGRFAVKEAAIKAHPWRKLTFHDVVVSNRKGDHAGSGPPLVIVKGEEGGSDQEARVSISHDGDYATAVCLGFKPGPHRRGQAPGYSAFEVVRMVGLSNAILFLVYIVWSAEEWNKKRREEEEAARRWW
ncbi:hypothetical protein OQA88_13092 [Cercophora sp. LCS_1]